MLVIIRHILLSKKNDLTESLEEASTVLFQWFDKGFLKNNLVKVHLLISK